MESSWQLFFRVKWEILVVQTVMCTMGHFHLQDIHSSGQVFLLASVIFSVGNLSRYSACVSEYQVQDVRLLMLKTLIHL